MQRHRAQEMNFALPAIALSVAFLVGTHTWRDIRPNPPTIVTITSLWVAFALPFLAKRSEFSQPIGAQLQPSPSLSSAVSFTLWAGAAICAGLALARPDLKPFQPIRRKPRPLPLRALLVIAFVLTILRFVIGGPINRYSGDIAEGGSGYAAYLPHVSASLILAATSLYQSRLNAHMRLLVMLTLSTNLAIFWLSGVRYIVLAYLIATLTLMMVKKKAVGRKLRRRTLATVAIGAVILLGVLGNERAVTTSSYDPLQRAVIATEVLGTTSVAMHFTESSGLLHGRSYLDATVQPIPRALWPDKPRPATQLFLYQITDPSQGRAITAPGEAYINFGFLGSLIFLLIFGFVSGVITSRILDMNNNSWAMTVYALVCILLVNGYFRGYAIATAYQLAFVVGPFLILGRAYPVGGPVVGQSVDPAPDVRTHTNPTATRSEHLRSSDTPASRKRQGP